MTGEVSFNPAARGYGLQDSVSNDDFMANMHFNQIRQTGKIPGVTETAGSPAFRGQLEQDVYEPSSGMGLGGVVATTAAGAAASGAGGYYLASNPIKDLANKTLNPDFYKTIDAANLAKKLEVETKRFNIAQLAKATDFDSLPDSVKQYFTANNIAIRTPQQAQAVLSAANVNPANYENLDDALKNVTSRFRGMQYHAANFTNVGLFEELNNAKNVDELKAIINKNKNFFGITGATEAEIAQQVDQLAAKGKNGLIAEANSIKDAAAEYIKNQENKIFAQIDAKTGKLLDTADDGIKQLFKDFKWQQAKKYGKWGAIAVGTGALLYSLFGGSSKQQA